MVTTTTGDATTINDSGAAITPPSPPGSASAGVIVSTSPATRRRVGEVPITPLGDVERIMANARRAQPAWFRAGLHHRLEMIRRFKESLRRGLDTLVSTVVAEQGRPPFEVLSEYFPSIELLAHYERAAPRALAPRRLFISLAPHRIHWIERRPFGVVLVIAPWNFPLVQSIPPIVAALLTGNTVVYKPSEYAAQAGEAMARMIHEAGIPPDVFQIVHGLGDLGAALVNARPDKIAFTGSVSTGRKIGKAAGELLIPATLELGAKDAAIVLADADLDRTARGLVWGGMLNAGQACLSVERVYVHRSVHDALVQRMARVIEQHIRVGPGEGLDTTMGAITTEMQAQIIDSQVREAVAQGAKVITGGRLDDANPRCYLPTIVTDVTPDMRLMQDETFGPVIAVVAFDDEEEALRAVNNSPYGLTASVWTRNRGRGLALAARLEVGHASVNDHVMSATLPQLPWGGTKDTGYGTMRGVEGLLEMTRPQSFSIERFKPLPSEYFWYPYTSFKYNLLRRAIRALYAPSWRERFHALLNR